MLMVSVGQDTEHTLTACRTGKSTTTVPVVVTTLTHDIIRRGISLRGREALVQT